LLCTSIGRHYSVLILVDIALYWHHVQHWDVVIARYVHHPLAMEDELPVNPYIDARPKVFGAVAYLREREAKSTSGRKLS
jgi:hypothetical protein